VSHARRDNEFYRVIQEFGGIAIVNVKEFVDAHVALLGTLAEAREPTSAPPGTRVDRRTTDATLSKLEKDGRIKILKTTLTTPIFTTRKVTIAYLSHFEEEKIQAFLSTLNQGHPTRTTVQAQKRSDQSHDSPSKPPRSTPSLTKSIGVPDSQDTAIRESIIGDPHGHSVPQMYGFIVGRIARARKLHLLSLRPFELESNDSPNIISRNARIIYLDYFLRDITIADYCSLFSVRPPVEGLDGLVHPESGSSPALWDAPENILSALGLGASRNRNRLMELLSILEDLRLVAPLQQSQSDTPFLTREENGTHPTSFDVIPQASWSTSAANLAPKYWHIRPSAPVHIWASPENPPPFWKTFPLRTAAEGEDFWTNLREVSLNSKEKEKTQDEEIPLEDRPNFAIRNSLRREAGWLTTYYISSHQESFLNKFLDKPPLSDDEEARTQLAHLSWVTLAPESAIKRFYATALNRRTQQVQRRKKKESSQEEKRALVAQKAAKGKDKRVKLWDQLLANSHPALVGKPLPPRVQRVRTEFLKTPSVTNEKQWEQNITTAIQEEGTYQSLHLAGRPKGPAAIPFPSGSATAAERSIAQLISEQNKMQNFSEAPVRTRKDKEKSGQFHVCVHRRLS
jgi:oxalate---CoA ligase